MQFPQMIYKFPADDGEVYELHDGKYSTLIVQNVDELELYLAEGWHESTTQARQASEKVNEVIDPIDEPIDYDAPPTREELEQKATELFLTFDGRTSDKKLSQMIAAAL
jgi:hypothetical protein